MKHDHMFKLGVARYTDVRGPESSAIETEITKFAVFGSF